MNNTLMYQNTLSSNYHKDCRIPYLENNSYIYGALPHQFNPSNSSPQKTINHNCSERGRTLSPYTDQGSNSYSSKSRYQYSNDPYSAEKNKKYSVRDTQKSTNYEDRSEVLSSKTPEKPSPGYQRGENREIPNFLGRYASHNPNSNFSEDFKTNFKEENLLIQLKAVEYSDKNNSKLESSPLVNYLEDSEKQKKLKEDSDKSLQYQLEERIEKEKADYYQFRLIKEKEATQKQEENLEAFLKAKLREEKTFYERQQKSRLELEQEILLKKQEEFLKIEAAKKSEKKRLEEIAKAEHERLLELKRLEDLRRVEAEREQEKRRLDELEKLEYQRRLEIRRQEELDKEKMVQEQLEYRRSVLREQQEEYQRDKIAREEHLNKLREIEDLKKTKNSEKKNLDFKYTEKQALKEQIGRESRQFLREKELSRNSPSKGLASRNQSNEFKPKIKSNPLVKEKVRTQSAKKTGPHHLQQTFSTKVKAMPNMCKI